MKSVSDLETRCGQGGLEVEQREGENTAHSDGKKRAPSTASCLVQSLWRVIWRGEGEVEEQTKQPRARPTDTGWSRTFARQYRRRRRNKRRRSRRTRVAATEVGAEKAKEVKQKRNLGRPGAI